MSKTLILMRHAKSSWSAPADSDHDRPLNTRGKTSAQALGKWLRAKGYVPDEVLCSTARRTRQTFEGLGIDILPTFTDSLYHADAETLRQVLSRARGETVLLLGHNPGIADCAGKLAQQAPDHPRFHDYPTGATLVVSFDIEAWEDVAWAVGSTVDFTVPRELAETL